MALLAAPALIAAGWTNGVHVTPAQAGVHALFSGDGNQSDHHSSDHFDAGHADDSLTPSAEGFSTATVIPAATLIKHTPAVLGEAPPEAGPALLAWQEAPPPPPPRTV